MYIRRILTDKLYKLAGSFPVVVVSGARQVGKSTLLQNTLGMDAEIVVFDPVIDIENARQDPELFLNNHPPPLILDEIQYAPELVASIKRRIDLNRSPGQYILTGSQQWGVMKSMSESLAGRAVFLDLDSFCLLEISQSDSTMPWIARWLNEPDKFLSISQSRLGHETTLYEQLWRGFLPESQFLAIEVIPDFLNAYQRTYIERDVRLLAEVSNLQLFGRFLQLVSALTAQEINHSQLGRELGMTPQTAQRWLDILKATADEGIDVAKEFNLVISDIEMPIMDGYTLTAEIRADARLKDLNVMLHSSLSGGFNDSMTTKVKADKFIPKFKAEELAKEIKELLIEKGEI